MKLISWWHHLKSLVEFLQGFFFCSLSPIVTTFTLTNKSVICYFAPKRVDKLRGKTSF